MKKKYLILSLIASMTFSAAVVFASFKTSSFASPKAQTCEHVGNHYSMKAATETESGWKEFWVCCKCHEVYLTMPEGQFVDNDASQMTGGVNYGHPAYIAPLSGEYIVTFIQEGQEDIIRTVAQGGTLLDIPTPASKTGYTVTWDTDDFTNINGNMTVYAVETAKTYNVYLNANGGFVTQANITVTYDQAYTLETPTHEEYGFNTWKYNSQEVPLSGIWNIDVESGTITLIAEWGDSEWTDIY